MRILVCTKRDIHGAHFLNRLLPALAGHEVLSVWLSDKNRDAEAAVSELAELRFVERTLPADLLFPLIDMLPEAQRRGFRNDLWKASIDRGQYQEALSTIDSVDFSVQE